MTEASIDLAEISARLGFSQVPEVLGASATPIRRGHHLALLAGRGSGKESVIALAVVEACDASEESLQAMILVPEAEYAWTVAAAVQRVVGPEGFTVACPSAVPGDDGTPEVGRALPAGHVLVGRPSELLPEVRAGHYSLSGLRLLVLDDVAAMHALDEWTSVEPILETLPGDSRKLAISDRSDPAFTRLIERQLPRARRWPEELLPAAAAPSERAAEQPPASVRCALVPVGGFVEGFRRCVRDADGLGCGRVDLVFPTAERAARAAAELTVAGLSLAGGPAEGEDDGEGEGEEEAGTASRGGEVVTVELPGEGPPAVVYIGLPPRQESLARAFAGEGPRYAVVEPRHAAQMELHVRRMNRRLDPLGGQRLAQELDPVRRYRTRLRQTAEQVDLMSELLILEPLFEEMGAVRVAAVLSELLRQRTDEDVGPIRPWADMEAASAAGAAPSTGRTRRRPEEVPRGARPAWTRLYFGVGRRDDASPGDLVGAITGETGIAGAQIGKIEIMGNFSLVDVDSQVADAVIHKLDGVQIRGREVPVRRDREG